MRSKKGSGQIINCKHCGKPEYVPQYRLSTFKFCSRSCSYHWKVENLSVTKKCLICSSNFSIIKHRSETAKYCSEKCRYESMRGRGRTKFTCQHCSCEFMASASTKRKFCSRTCVGKASKLIFKPSFTTVRKAMIKRGLVQKCERCGFDEPKQILGIHHKDRDRTNNDISNLEVLCPNCHSIEHMKHTPHGFVE